MHGCHPLPNQNHPPPPKYNKKNKFFQFAIK